MRLIASREFKYGSRYLKAGEDFEAADRDARVLVFIGYASEEKPKPKRRYKRRDMQAVA